jgi:competence protein ComEA
MKIAARVYRHFVSSLIIVFLAWICLAPVAYSQALIDVNSADLKTLETLPGIGSTTAQRIIDGRPYQSLDDLGKVKGLSQKKLNAIKDQITFSSPAHTSSTTTNAVKSAKKSKKSKSTTTSQESSTTPASSAQASVPPPAPAATTSSSGSSSTRYNNSSSSSSGSSSTSSVKLAPGEKININTASAEELDRLPGIGKTKAQAIIDYRTQNGSFQNLEDIQKVKGIKSGEYAKLKDYIKLSN